ADRQRSAHCSVLSPEQYGSIGRWSPRLQSSPPALVRRQLAAGDADEHPHRQSLVQHGRLCDRGQAHPVAARARAAFGRAADFSAACVAAPRLGVFRSGAGLSGYPCSISPAYWIPAFWVPALLVTHYVVFVVLGKRWSGPM